MSVVSYDNSFGGFSSGVGDYTFSYTNAGNYLMVNTYATVSAVTYNGVSMSVLQTYTPTGIPFGANCPPIRVWGLSNPYIGTANIVVTGGGLLDTAVISLKGVGEVTQPSYSNTNDTHGGQTGTLSSSATVSKNGSWIVAFIRGGNNLPRTWVATSGSTLRQGGSASILVDACGIADLNTAENTGTYSCGFDWASGSGFSTMITMAISPQPPFTGSMQII